MQSEPLGYRGEDRYFDTNYNHNALYRAVADLGWDNFVFGCSKPSQILLGQMMIRLYWHSSGINKVVSMPLAVKSVVF